MRSASSAYRRATTTKLQQGKDLRLRHCLTIAIIFTSIIVVSCSYDPEFDALSAFPANDEQKSLEQLDLVIPHVDDKVETAERHEPLTPVIEAAEKPLNLGPGTTGFRFNSVGMSSGRFERVESSTSGLNRPATVQWNTENSDMLQSPFTATGLACGDFNGDRLADLLIVNQEVGVRLYRNLGNLEFKDITVESGIEIPEMWGVSVTVIDINNDGLLDFYLCGYDQKNRLYVNRGRKFVEVAAGYGLDIKNACVAASFADFDRDGDLDLYLVTHRLYRTGRAEKVPVEFEPGKLPRVKEAFREIQRLIPYHDGGVVPVSSGQYDYLYRNDDSKFVDVTVECLGEKTPYRGMAATWCDFDNDGWPDLYVANDNKDPDQLFRNQGPNQDGVVQLVDVSTSVLNQTPWFSTGVDIADLNQDGLVDIVIGGASNSLPQERTSSQGNLVGPRSDRWFLGFSSPTQVFGNGLLLNSFEQRFSNIARLAGVAHTDTTWSIRAIDFDNDGLQDLFCANGAVRDFLSNDLNIEAQRQKQEKNIQTVNQYWVEKRPLPQMNFLYRNSGGLVFESSNALLANQTDEMAQTSLVCDLDGDGDLDIVTCGMEAPVAIWRNDGEAENSLVVKLKGQQSNHAGIGASLHLHVNEGERAQVRYGTTTRGFLSSEENLIHFGLGQHERVQSLQIRWPSGTSQTVTDLPANHFIVIEEPQGAVTVGRGLQMDLQKTLFRRDAMRLEDVAVAELEYDDFAAQPTLPWGHSMQGPSLAWTDLDADGDYDLFVGGSTYEPGRLFENRGEEFRLVKTTVFKKDSRREDLGSIFFDLDNDGDQDLYVASGGVEDGGASAYQDRLYLNTGKGEFVAADELTPPVSSSTCCVAAADFDKDRGIDLFVGGHVDPKAYPTAPRSYLLHNDAGKLIDVTDKFAPELKESGMVTGCVWSDVNNDQWLDLVLCSEWGNVRVFKNNGKQLKEVQDPNGFTRLHGLFNSLSPGDVDNDGDIDFVLANQGVNTSYFASTAEPMRLRSIESKSENVLVESYTNDGLEYPFRPLHVFAGRLTLSEPGVSEFEFASTTLEKSFPALTNTDGVKINELRSGVLLNQSSGGEVRFDFVPLPARGQMSPLQGCQLVDVDGDGNLDLYGLQNKSSVHPLTEKANNGHGVLLLGNGDGTFRELGRDSGVVMPGDGRALTVADINEDGRADFVAAETESRVSTFLNQSSHAPFAIDLKHVSDRKMVVGTKIRLYFKDGTVQLHEIRIGSGYLSQSPPIVFSSPKAKGGIKAISIVWPDGTEKSGDIKTLHN